MVKAGRAFIAIMFFVGLIGVLVNGAPIFSRFLYSAVLLALFAWGWTRLVIRSLSFERVTRELRANVGDVFEETFKFNNRSRLPIPWVEIVNKSTLPFAAGSRLFTLVL
ncbi:MAG TPA: hypothetical protein PKJ84_10630, partial [Anaerolineales bacterium]|nr:hypothetical protein [Anaerolineales bacterium]